MKVSFITQNRSDLFMLYFVAVTCANYSKLHVDVCSRLVSKYRLYAGFSVTTTIDTID